MVNQLLEAIVEKLRVLTPEDSELLKAIWGDKPSTYSGNISVLELDCLKEGYFKEYHQLTALTRYNLSVNEIEKLELELLVTGERKRYDDCCRETEVVPSTESIRFKEKELLGAGKWKEYHRIENHTKVSLSPKDLKPFEASLREEQKELLTEGKIDEYFNKVSETGIRLPKPQIEKVLTGYLLKGEWDNYLILSKRTEVKLNKTQLEELMTKIEVTDCQIKDFKEGLTYGNFHPFSMSRECLGSMPEVRQIQVVQCEYLLRLLDDTNHRYRTCLRDKKYQESVKATGVSVSLEQLELVGRLKSYRS